MHFFLIVLIFSIIGGSLMSGYLWFSNKDNLEYDSSNYIKSFILGAFLTGGAIFGYSALQGSSLVSDQEIYTGNPDF